MKLQNFCVLIVVFLTGLFIGKHFFALKNKREHHENKREFSEIRDGQYSFINPLLECSVASDAFVELKPFKDKVNDEAEKNIKNKLASFVSVYFRDLNNGPWFGINETEKFFPASLMKVPVMMAYFKIAENSPEILNRQLVAGQEEIGTSTINSLQSSETLEVGKSYAVLELIRRMIVYSDNASARLLIGNIDPLVLSKVYSDFGIDLDDIMNGNTQVTVRNYAGFFRVLFNASYLSRQYSEKALEILSQADFKEGLAGGVNKEIIVANKFGELDLDNKQKQLHDCGIVYYPKHPYLLCIMTRGDNVKNLATTIKNISNNVFEEISKQFLTSR
jgi:beta-lactamase class A